MNNELKTSITFVHLGTFRSGIVDTIYMQNVSTIPILIRTRFISRFLDYFKQE